MPESIENNLSIIGKIFEQCSIIIGKILSIIGGSLKGSFNNGKLQASI